MFPLVLFLLKINFLHLFLLIAHNYTGRHSRRSQDVSLHEKVIDYSGQTGP